MRKEKQTVQRIWVCYYINSRGDEKQKVFKNENDGLRFTETLDKRIEKGTCYGYSFSYIDRTNGGF